MFSSRGVQKGQLFVPDLLKSRNGHFTSSLPPKIDLEGIQGKIGKRVKKLSFQKKGAMLRLQNVAFIGVIWAANHQQDQPTLSWSIWTFSFLSKNHYILTSFASKAVNQAFWLRGQCFLARMSGNTFGLHLVT